MKKIKQLKYLVLLIIAISFSNCGQDNSFEIIDDQAIEMPQTKEFEANSNCNGSIIVTFSFDPGTTANEKYIFKNKYYAKRVSAYGICKRIVSPTCPDKEKWIVDMDKYYNLNPFGQTTGNVNETGKGRRGCIRPEDCPEIDESCFIDGFVYYDGYGEFGGLRQ